MKYHAYVIAVLNEWQLFDRKFVDAVLNEWQKTMMDLPSGFRQAYEMVNYHAYNIALLSLYLVSLSKYRV